LHSRPALASEKIKAAYNAGCRRFDSALGGLGGCPFAQDELVGNMPTEVVLETLRELGENVPIRKQLDNVLKMSELIGAGSPSTQIQ
jgi:hydroxymethylglutaryl-CoA lyase